MTKPSRLNLEALRRRDWSDTSFHTKSLNENLELSRRQFLVLGGTAAAGFSTTGWIRAPFEVRRRGDTISFWDGNHEAWVIDPSRFAGSPKLTLKNNNHTIEIALRDAYFPGTDLIADFHCTIAYKAKRWKMLFNFVNGTQFNAGFVEWLSGSTRALAKSSKEGVTFSSGGEIRFSAPVQVELTPSWQLVFDGEANVSVSELSNTLKSDRVILSLGAHEDSLTSRPLSKRTLIQLERSGRDWAIPVTEKSSLGWELDAGPSVFDKLTIELGENDGVQVHTALLTQSRESAASVRFSPGNSFKAQGDNRFNFELEASRLAITLGETIPETAFVAGFARRQGWMSGKTFNLQLGGGPQAPPFELIRRNGLVESLKVMPLLLAVGAPLGGQAASLLIVEGDKLLPFAWQGLSETAERAKSSLRISTTTNEFCEDLTRCTLSVIRPSDLLRLDFKFTNLFLTNDFSGDLVLKPTAPDDPNRKPTITVTFPPQSIVERAFYERPPGYDLDYEHFVIPNKPLTPAQKKLLEPDLPARPGDPPIGEEPLPREFPVQARIAESSRLVFEVPPSIKSIKFELDDLLNWKPWNLKVHPVALSADDAKKTAESGKPCAEKPAISPPNGYTSIEMPYRVMVSPHKDAAWAHSLDPVDHKTNFVELWHTRLAIKNSSNDADENDDSNRTIRAIWSPDFRSKTEQWPEHSKHPFRMPLDIRDRHEFVHLTSNYCIEERTDCDNAKLRPFVPGALQVNQLMLSSLGGWLKSKGMWEPPAVDFNAGKILTVEAWRHLATLGRDHYVQVVYKGYLLPFGHRASLIKVTERKIQANPAGVFAAFSRQRMYIIVRDTKKGFPAFGHPSDGRAFPWAVEIMTLVTPSLDDPETETGFNQSMFWPTIAGVPFEFGCKLTGGSREALFSIPCLFVDNQVAYDRTRSEAARRAYNLGTPQILARRDRDFHGQKIAFAASNQPGDTQYDTNRITFKVEFPQNLSDDQQQCLYIKGQPFFYPALETAQLNPAAVRRITGNTTPVKVQYTAGYLASGFDPNINRGEVFFEVAPGSSLALNFGGPGKADQSGGVITPNMNIVGFSRKNGPVGGGGRPGTPTLVRTPGLLTAPTNSAIAKIQNGEFDPLDYFGGALEKAKILGGISLWDIIKPLAAGAISNLRDAPKVLEETLYPAIQQLTEIEATIVRLLGNLHPVVTQKLSAEIQEVRDSFAHINTSQFDLAGQARFIRSLTRLVDRMNAILQDPNQLIEDAFRGLLTVFADYEAAVKKSALQILDEWTGLYAQDLALIENKLKDLVVTGLEYEDQIRSYVQEARNVVAELRAQIKTIVDLANNPRELAKAIGPLLAAEIPALANLDELRKQAVTLFQLVKDRTTAQLRTLKDDLIRKLKSEVQVWTIDVAPAREKIEEFEALSQIFIASLPEASRRDIQRLARQITEALRSLLTRSGESVVKDLQTIQKQILTNLQQLQLIVFNASQPLLTTRRRTLAANEITRLLQLMNELATTFTIVGRAMNAANLEDLLRAIEPVLPAQLRTELATIRDQLASIRRAIQTASGDVTLKLVSLQIQLFDLWVKYQDPYKLAADVFGLSDADIARLKDLETQSRNIIELARQTRATFTTLLTEYQTLVRTLPTVPQAILRELTRRAEDAVAAVVRETVEEKWLILEQQAISALTDLYAELMRRIQRPLEGLQDLLSAKQQFEELLQKIALPRSVTLTYEWKPRVKDFEPVFIIEKDKGELAVNARATTFFDGTPPEFSVDGQLTNFSVNLIAKPAFITINFARFTFKSRNGAKPDCQVKIKSVELGKPMDFVQKLQRLLSPTDKDGPFLELDFLGIRAGYRFGVPAITVGGLNIQNLRLIVAVSLPFNGDPMRCEFALSERNHPFLLSVGIYGGGGFLRLRLGLDGVELLEGALEFGVVARISIGIATGSGFVMAGIYFSVTKTEAKVCGFVHANGHLDVLGLISVDLDVLVQVCYVRRGNSTSVEGEARIIIHIEILFFEIDVELHARYQFVGSGGGSALRAASLRTGCNPPDQQPSLPPGDSDLFCELASPTEFRRYRRAFAW